MTVPSRVEAATLLRSLEPPPWFVAHARAVAEVAGWLAQAIDRRGTPVDRAAVEAAALLHDIDKVLPATDPARTLRHGDGSADWLRRHGHPELGRLVAGHPVTRLADAEAFRRWAAFASREERIVAYADKRAGQRLESMDARFASWARRYPGAWDAGDGRRGARPGGPTRGGRVRRGRREPVRGPPTGVDGVRLAARSSGRMTQARLLYLYGDDDLVAGRLIDRYAAALAAEDGQPLERWDARADQQTAGLVAAQLRERLATAVLFGGGTLAVIADPGALVRRNDLRDSLLESIALMAPGHALVFVESAKANAKGPGSKRVADAVTAAGGRIVAAMAPAPGRPRRVDRDRGPRARTPPRTGRGARAGRPPRGAGHRRRRRAPAPHPDRLRRAR